MTKRIAYIAGPMTPRGVRDDTDNAAIEFLLNIRDMQQAALKLIAKGYAPYCPGNDHHFYLALQDGAVISETTIKDISFAFLEASDCIVLLPRWRTSPGAVAEYMRAIELGMPVFDGVDGVPDA